ncbi:LLM class flavin-dependent oxidoreductase [Puerhibacterium puerhi]|uniref:LLM class flavin-dependent oxidoreductase n=1 Tax=Puerhibacterium puerhi TaxID=2692623 RepID=UPI00135AF223|nr:LLM class flavin-dependent oxidoreductase [Puerhibacterium puerhi]
MPLPASTPHRTSLGATRRVILGVDLTAAGAGSAGHRARGAVGPRPFDGQRFVGLVRTADRALLDLVALDEGFVLHPGRPRAAGRLDAAVAAARAVPHTRSIGLVAAVDPFALDAAHVAAAVARIDRASAGRAGWQVAAPSATAEPDEAWAARAEPAVVAVARAWGGESVAAGDAAAGGGGVPPQCRPPVVVRVRSEACTVLAGRVADVARVAAADAAQAAQLRTAVRAAAVAAARAPDAVRVVVDAVVVLSSDRESAQARLELVEAEGSGATGALMVAGTPGRLATVIADWHAAGAADGFVLRPSALGPDLDAIAHHLVPELQRAGLFRTGRSAGTLRESLGLRGAPRARAGADGEGRPRRATTIPRPPLERRAPDQLVDA